MTREQILESRRAGFEKAIFDEQQAHLLIQCGDGYFNSSVDHEWRIWNAALDSVVIELPTVTESQALTASECKAIRCGIDMCAEEIKHKGLKTK